MILSENRCTLFRIMRQLHELKSRGVKVRSITFHSLYFSGGSMV
jgi:hypothetical protein